MGEGAHPQVGQRLLGHPHQAQVGEPEQHGHGQGHGGGHRAGRHHEAAAEALGPEHAPVQDLLDEHGHGEAATSADEGHEHGDADAGAQLGAVPQPPAQRVHRPAAPDPGRGQRPGGLQVVVEQVDQGRAAVDGDHVVVQARRVGDGGHVAPRRVDGVDLAVGPAGPPGRVADGHVPVPAHGPSPAEPSTTASSACS